MKFNYLILFFLCVQTAFAQIPAQPGAISGPTSVCAGASYTYTIAAVSSAAFYNWSLPAGWSGSSSTTSITVTVGTTGGNLQVAAGNISGVSAATGLSILVNPSPSAVVSPQGPINFCPNTVGTSVQAAVIPGVSYQWLNNGFPILSAQSPSYFIATAGNFQLVMNLNGCADTSAPITVINQIAPPKPSITAQGATTFCTGNHVLLTTSSASNIIWSTGANSSQIWATTTGAYYVTEHNAFGCVSTSDTIQVTALDLPAVSAGNDTVIYMGQALTLTGSGADAYHWTPGALLNDSLSQNPIAHVNSNTVIQLIGTGSNTCVDTADISITVLPAPLIEPLAAFTPNGDGKHDTWVIKHSRDVQEMTILVVDRYGAKVYSFTGIYKDDWDASYNGVALPDADYYYHIQYKQTDGTPQQVNGSVTILR